MVHNLFFLARNVLGIFFNLFYRLWVKEANSQTWFKDKLQMLVVMQRWGVRQSILCLNSGWGDYEVRYTQFAVEMLQEVKAIISSPELNYL